MVCVTDDDDHVTVSSLRLRWSVTGRDTKRNAGSLTCGGFGRRWVALGRGLTSNSC